jgi:hypothetical protein
MGIAWQANPATQRGLAWFVSTVRSQEAAKIRRPGISGQLELIGN